MKLTYFSALLLCAAVYLLPSAAPAPVFATEVLRPIAIPDHDGSASISIDIPKFDTWGGTRTLTEVRIRIEGKMERTYYHENTHPGVPAPALQVDDAGGGTGTQIHTAILLIPVSGSTNVDFQNQITYGPHTLSYMGRYDGTTDFDGDSGTTEGSGSLNYDETAADSSSDASLLAAMSFDGDQGISVTLAATNFTNAPSCSQCAYGTSDSVDSGLLHVTYVY